MKSSAEFTSTTRRLDPLEPGRGIVVARRVDLVDQVVGIERGACACSAGVRGSDRPSRGVASVVLHEQRRAAGDQQQVDRACAAPSAGCARVLAALPGRIVAGSRPRSSTRHRRLRPTIATGWQASGISASMKSG